MKFFKKRDETPEPAPAVPEPVLVEEPAAPAEPAAPPAPPIRVVLIDDDDDVRELMRMGLTRGGFEIVGEARDGKAAVAVVRETQPAIVLLDLHMPEVGGLEVLPHLKAEAPRAKFVVVSAIGATHMLEATLDSGASAFIEKGVSIRSIVIHLERVATSGAVKVVRPYPLNREYPSND